MLNLHFLLQTYSLEQRNLFVSSLDYINDIKECIDTEILTSILNFKEQICAGEKDINNGNGNNLILIKKKMNIISNEKINPSIYFIQEKLNAIIRNLRNCANYRKTKISKDIFFTSYYEEINSTSVSIKTDINQIYNIDTKIILSDVKDLHILFNSSTEIIPTILIIGKLDVLIKNTLQLMSGSDNLKTNILSFIQILLDQQSKASVN
jgi:hypothetical protein